MTTTQAVRILILGGGFAGLNTAFNLSNWPWTHPVEITLVDRNDRFLFTPMAYEILTHEVESWEVAPTYREIIGQRPISFVQGTIDGIDSAKREVQVGGKTLGYDYLVIALGGRPNFRNVPGAAEFSKPFYDLRHVQTFQKHVATLLDQAKQTTDPAKRKELLNFLIVGGGTCGVEVSCKLADQLDVEARERGLNRDEMCIHLIDRNERILRGIAQKIEPIAVDELKRRHVNLILDTKVTKVTAQGVELENGKGRTTVTAASVVWTGGIEMPAVLGALPFAKDESGRIRVTRNLEVEGHPNILALGDLSHFPTTDGHGLPATAQVAVRQAEIAAWNIRAKIENLPLLPYIYIPLGEMVTLGVGSAGADVFGVQLGGPFAAAMRQMIYLTKLPTIGHKVRVSRSWIMTAAGRFFEAAQSAGQVVGNLVAPLARAGKQAVDGRR